MNNSIISVDELLKRLESAKIPKDFYSLDGYKEEALCIEHNEENWLVYEGERGNRFNLESFPSEADACLSFIRRIKDYL